MEFEKENSLNCSTERTDIYYSIRLEIYSKCTYSICSLRRSKFLSTAIPVGFNILL